MEVAEVVVTIDVIAFLRSQAAEWEHIEQVHDAIERVTEALAKKMEVEYVGPLYRTDFSVTGHGPFPIDMLRYTCSWPADESEAKTVEDSLEHADYADPFTIRLSRYHRDPKPNLSEDRWLSKFRCKIVGIVETMEL